jgi:methyl-accepting chemotaxis protein
MNKPTKSGASTLWVTLMTLGIVGCLVGVVYTFFTIRNETAQEGQYRQVAESMRAISKQVEVDARQSVHGDRATFAALQRSLDSFAAEMDSLRSAGLVEELRRIDIQWQPIEAAVAVLLASGPQTVSTHALLAGLQENVVPLQAEITHVVDVLRNASVSSATLVAAQKMLWLTERLARNLERITMGGNDSEQAAVAFRADAQELLASIEALRTGDRALGINRITSDEAMRSLDIADGLFSDVASAVDQVVEASPMLRQAAAARETVESSSAALSDAIALVVPALDRLTVARLYDRGTLMALFAAPGVLAVGLLVVLYRGQQRRMLYTEQGVAAINGALVRIAEGDLTVRVPEDNTVTRDIAREINASTERQRELIRNIRVPFEEAVREIDKIGVTARGQVEKGKELTRSVVESTTAATEMVRASEEIKRSTAEAARTSERNRLKVSQGYELTKDMSRASANVRESVQETSKSAKRQSELIQSVTAAAEYIQALNTKISVVAINTRIEAEKAGEYGRPFLGIAEAIGDLLREAEEEGRKIISEVRMLQNMSAENLGSMENTVGTVVTILEYIDRLDSSLEEIKAGSAAITSIIKSVDEAAGQSAESALHMNSSMAEIRERNGAIGKYSESTQVGVRGLQESMRDVAANLGQFRIRDEDTAPGSVATARQEAQRVTGAGRVVAEAEVFSLEAAERKRASV